MPFRVSLNLVRISKTIKASLTEPPQRSLKCRTISSIREGLVKNHILIFERGFWSVETHKSNQRSHSCV